MGGPQKFKLKKERTHEPLYLRKSTLGVNEKLNQMSEDSGMPKWLIADSILSAALGVKSDSVFDVKKWLKK